MNAGSLIPENKWALLQSGSEPDFYAFYRQCYQDFYRFGLYLYHNPVLVNEGIHLLFIELWEMRDKFSTVNHPREYIFTIYRRILYKLKTGAQKHWSKLETMADVEPITVSYEELLITAQEDERKQILLRQILPQLPARQLELIRLRYLEEKSIEEMVQLTNLSPRTIYNTLHNALGRLRELLRGSEFIIAALFLVH